VEKGSVTDAPVMNTIHWKRIVVAVVVAAVGLWTPFGWLVLIDYPWDSYHLFWLKLWPILPGFVPAFFCFHPHDVVEFISMGIVTVALFIGLSWLGMRGRMGLVAAAVVALLISIPSAWFAYCIFRA
jgi:hypothetical protein